MRPARAVGVLSEGPLVNILRLFFGSRPRPVALSDDPAYADAAEREARAKARLCTYDAAVARQMRRQAVHDKLADELGRPRLSVVRGGQG